MENIDKIKAQRINGWLDLNSYFEKRLGRSFQDEEDLFANGLIDVEHAGRSDKFWILDDEGNKLALFKEPINFYGEELYAELFSEEICKVLDIPTAHYDLAKFRGTKGVISYNFKKDHDKYSSGFDLIAEFYEKNLEYNRELSELYGIDYINDSLDDVSDKLNNLEDIWIILEHKYKEHPQKQYIVSKIMDGLVNKLIFDILTINIDDHADNWGEFDELEEGKMIAPMFDNSRIINLHNNVLVDGLGNSEKIEDKKLSLIIDNDNEKRKPLEVLEYFLNISSSEYRDLVRDKVNLLKNNIDNIPIVIENRTEHKIPEYLKDYFVVTMREHLDKVETIVDSKGKSVK